MYFIYKHRDWPNFVWDNEALLNKLAEVRNMQGKIMGRMQSLGFDLRNEAVLDTLSLDIIKSNEIEGVYLNAEQVRSSVARRLGIEIAGALASDRNVDGVVDMMLDATQRYNQPVTEDRLFGWHSALFPEGRSGMYKITVACWRTDSTGPMQVVSGAMGHEKVHYQAPDSFFVAREMAQFIHWFNHENKIDPVIKAAIAHLWFVTIHPFDDGNGRIARALTDMLLARSDNSPQRFYSMSAQIRIERKQYYEILERTQKGSLDITHWLLWFLNSMLNALKTTEITLSKILYKAEFWNKHLHTVINERQRSMLNKLLDGFDGKLTTSKWAKITKCSPDTSLRDIQDLIHKGILQKAAAGRSTNYELCELQ
ncbi:MAG: Fic family protein [Prevotellaceae bacterium]|jgi:Fic family protein|nr:Fic family protein [Prevotellaceae bacterium]